MIKIKVLIITGQQAETLIRKNLKNYTKHEIYLKVIPMPIAAFITPKIIIYHLKQKNILNSLNNNNTTPIDNIDMIITPGLIRQDTTEIEKQLKIKAYKGPSNAADLKLTLDIIDKIELSTNTPADKLIRDQQYQEAIKTIKNYENPEHIKQLLEKKGNIQINTCPVGPDFPMRILGEIANAPQLTDKQLLNKVQYYLDSGADMIDIGMHAGENNPQQAHHMIKLIKDNYDTTVSIDTMNTQEIKEGLKAGADMVLSLDHGNYEKVINDIKDYDAKAVIIPTNYKTGYIPKTAEEKVQSLESLDKKCHNITTIADLLLDPINSPSLTESIQAYKTYREQNPYKTMFLGIGNVSELLDADSNGVNAVLTGIAMEININILFTPESSPKTRGSIKELKTASDMMFLSKIKNNIPKNLGIHLIQYKDQYAKDDVNIDTNDIPEIKAVADGKFIPDTRGSFKIIVSDGLIKAIHYKDYVKHCVITGTTARAIYEEILRRNMISRMEHSAYLGMELEKAEIALKLDKTYIQDFPIF
ncbi:dihydropteroate synthase-like protein [Methanosphaera sp. ISO3-F5]|uniref:dihydropteroate synthase-like protein n=1 Tax=Methanosphaera sp. ISO3-F5 TaxID=1452353 RepID=UPI002B25D800|nr:dihydropteroate synthase-like protein [Methanosphaera sp. ISO3-F5]WQH65220.1 dihydropteroate synthase-like protein [Methanosphaera sp. ISO3-F5]